MRNKKRIKRITDLLKGVWEKQPDMRLGQLLENYIFDRGRRGDVTSVCLFYQDDRRTEANLKELKKDSK